MVAVAMIFRVTVLEQSSAAQFERGHRSDTEQIEKHPLPQSFPTRGKESEQKAASTKQLTVNSLE
jgi:hypothetical protein